MNATNFKLLILVATLALHAAACRSTFFKSKSRMDSPIIELETTEGTIAIQLYAQTPKHRDNFVKLVKAGFYDGLLFHRVIQDFMIQAGDPDSKNAAPHQPLGMGDAGYTIPAEFDTALIHTRGAVCAARKGDNVNPERASSGCQFYIVHNAELQGNILDQVERYRGFKYTAEQRAAYEQLGGTPHLDREYTVFGNVLEGMDVVDKIATQPVGRNDRPLQDIKIIRATVRKGNAA